MGEACHMIDLAGFLVGYPRESHAIVPVVDPRPDDRPATDNVVILHGALGSPLDFLGAEDLVENLALTYDNVVLFSYPSARGVAYAANELYNQILANRKPGFGCRIIGHSLGALIGRYLLEASPTDFGNRMLADHGWEPGKHA